MKSLHLTFHNGSTRSLEAVSYCMGRRGVVIMMPGGRMVRFGNEDLRGIEESNSPCSSKPEGSPRDVSSQSLGLVGFTAA